METRTVKQKYIGLISKRTLQVHHTFFSLFVYLYFIFFLRDYDVNIAKSNDFLFLFLNLDMVF